jgi:hypothetical protein
VYKDNAERQKAYRERQRELRPPVANAELVARVQRAHEATVREVERERA